MSKTNVFVIKGHGSEYVVPFEQRVKIPAGYTVVIFTACSVPIRSVVSCKIIEYLKDPKNYERVSNPTYDGIGKDFPSVRIYSEGDSLPLLITSLESTDEINNKKKYNYKAGVYKLPRLPIVDRESFPISEYENKILREIIGECRTKNLVAITDSDTPITRELYKEIYKGAVFGPSYEASIKGDYNIPLVKIMNRRGAGVYYFMSCRSSAISDISKEDYNNAFKEAERLINQRAQNRKLNKMKKVSTMVDKTKQEQVKQPSSKSSASSETVKARQKIDPKKHSNEDIENNRYRQNYLRVLNTEIRKKGISEEDKKKLIAIRDKLDNSNGETETFRKSDEQQERKKKQTRKSSSN